jgi:peptidyl-prolyl cis-trans isomerase D
MITWMQTKFGRHHKVFLWCILVVIVVAFVLTIGAVPRGQATRGQGPRMLFGVNLNDQEQMTALQQSVAMSLAWQRHQARTTDEMEQALLGRLALLYLADQWGVPLPTEAQKAAFVQTLPLFKSDAGQFDPVLYQKFLDDLQLRPVEERNLTADTLAQNWRLQQVLAVLGGPGYALPFSAEVQAALRDTTWDLDVASLDYSKFTPKVTVTDAALQTFFNRDSTRFKKPAETTLSYVRFTAPASTATPTAADLEDFVKASPKDFPDVKDPAKLDAKTTAAATAAFLKAQDVQNAGALAQNFVKALSDQGVTRGTPAFDALLQKFNVQVETLPPVVDGKPAPADSPVSDKILQAVAPTLNAQNYFSDPVPLADGAAVLFFEQATPEHSPEFAEARADVAAAYTEEEKTRQFEARGQELQQALTKAVAGGQSFKDAATAQGLTVKDYPAVSFSNPPADMDYDLLAALANPNTAGVPLILAMKPGEVSEMQPTPDAGQFIYIAKRDIPALTADSPTTLTALKTMQGQEKDMSADALLTPILNNAVRTLQGSGG